MGILLLLYEVFYSVWDHSAFENPFSFSPFHDHFDKQGEEEEYI